MANILILDIERTKGRADIDFWDLGDYKNRRINPEDVTEWPRNICAAWNWLGEKRINFAAEWTYDEPTDWLYDVWEAYDKADIVVGHNLARFDTPKLRGAWAEMGLTRPSPWRTVDTLLVAKQFGFESNKLDALCRRLKIPGKTDHYDVEVARKALDGIKRYQRQLASYNKGDVVSTRGLYLYMRPWMLNHPHVGGLCPACSSNDALLIGEAPAATSNATMVYPLYQCTDCAYLFKGNKGRKIAETKGVA